MDIDIYSLMNPQLIALKSEGHDEFADDLHTALCGSTGSEILLGVYYKLKEMPLNLQPSRRAQLEEIKLKVAKVLKKYDWEFSE